jgi:hypothetical protein
VLELSSFQLDGVQGFQPSAAWVVLNVTQDHLDWHGSMDAYAAAKARIFGSRHPDGGQPRRPDLVVAMVLAPVLLKGGRGKPAGTPRRWCASGWTRRRGIRATSAWWSRTAWPGWCAALEADDREPPRQAGGRASGEASR